MPAPDYAVEIGQLQSAMASGELEVQGANGEMVKYRSIADIKQALSYYTGLAAQAGGTAKAGFGATVAAFDRS